MFYLSNVLIDSVHRAVLFAILHVLPVEHVGRELLSSRSCPDVADGSQNEAASQEQHRG